MIRHDPVVAAFNGCPGRRFSRFRAGVSADDLVIFRRIWSPPPQALAEPAAGRKAVCDRPPSTPKGVREPGRTRQPCPRSPDGTGTERDIELALKVIKVLIDDIDGSDADETVSFRIDGTDYEIDLSSENAAGLREALTQYIAAGRKSAFRGKPPARSKRQGKSQSPSSSDIREWARLNGYKTSTRGKIASRTLAAHEKATA